MQEKLERINYLESKDPLFLPVHLRSNRRLRQFCAVLLFEARKSKNRLVILLELLILSFFTNFKDFTKKEKCSLIFIY